MNKRLFTNPIIQFVMLFVNIALINAQYDYSELVPMNEYSQNFRTLDCWECFQAQGKMCHHRLYMSIMILTGSSNFGHSICCKPDYHEGLCQTSGDLICGPPSKYEEGYEGSYSEVLNDDMTNYQMFAFCPAVNPNRCGLNDTNPNMHVYGTSEE